MHDEDEDEYDHVVLSCVGPKGVQVMAEQCSTCIFRPGNLMNLNEGRLKEMTDSTDRGDTNVVCHQTLSDRWGAFCKGSVDRRAGQSVQIAERLGFIEFVTPSADAAQKGAS